MVRIGDLAPDFEARGADGIERLLWLRGRHVLVCFLCHGGRSAAIALAQGLQHQLPAFEALNAVVVGVGRRSDAAHAEPRERYRIDFPVAADPGSAIARAYGVAGPLHGLLPRPAGRPTFLISPDGYVVACWERCGPAMIPTLLDAIARQRQLRVELLGRAAPRHPLIGPQSTADVAVS